MGDDNVLGMSDAEFENLSFPSEEPTEVPEDTGESASESVADELPADETEYTEETADNADEFIEEDESAESEAEPFEDNAPESSESEESDEDDQSQESESKVDFKAFYEQITRPFKANGREMKIDSAEDVVRLMQMGANYNKKMAALKPNLKLMRMLDNNGLLSEEKLSFFIDLDKKNPDAIKKLVKDSGVDTYDLSSDTDENEYKPSSYTVDDIEFEVSEALAEIKSTPTYAETLSIINDKWDERSQRIIAENPQVISVLNDQVASGVYSQISAEIEKEKMLGRLSGVSDIEAYRIVGDRLFKEGRFDSQQTTSKESPEPTKTPSKKNIANAKRKRAAASPRSSKASTSTPSINPLALSDEEFEKEFSTKYL